MSRHQITKVLMRHGHYLDPEGPFGGTDVIEWMRVDADALTGCSDSESVKAALVDVGLHSADDWSADVGVCRGECVDDLVALTDQHKEAEAPNEQ